MFEKDRWHEIFENIRKNKLRTFLSGFTIALGILLFTILFGMGNGLENSFTEGFVDDAQNVIFLYSGKSSKAYQGFKEGRRIQFENDDLEFINKNFKGGIEYITPRIYKSYNVSYKKETGRYSARGVSPDHKYLERTLMIAGRYLNHLDVKNKLKKVVIGRLVEEDLFKKENALDKIINLNGINFQVVGVFKDEGNDNEERMIYIPYTTEQFLNGGHSNINQINLSYKKWMTTSEAIKFGNSILSKLKIKHVISPEDQSAIQMRNFAEDIKNTMQFLTILKSIVLLIGIGTLIAGIISISNIMIFTIKERTKEIGIRKAIGAKPADIIGMILQESIFITATAGFAGLIIGVIFLNSIGNKLEPWFIKDPYVDLSIIIFSTVILVAFGTLAGYFPARKAAKIKPIIALRDV